MVDDSVIGAELRAWRMYALGADPLSTRPAGEVDWSLTVDGPRPGDTVTVTLGEIPEDAKDAQRSARAMLPFMLTRQIDGRDASPEEIDEAIDRRTASVDLSDMTRGVKLVLSLSLRRPLEVRARPGVKYFWVDDSDAVGKLSAFEDEVRPYFDLVAAWLFPAVSTPGVGGIVRGSDRVYLTAPGRGALQFPHPRVGNVNVFVGSQWADLPLDDLRAAVVSLSAMPGRAEGMLATPARWLTAASRESDDILRRFLFAYFGLETLANKIGRLVKARVVADVRLSMDGAPIDQLVWPSPRESDAPHRNVVFNFTCMAIALAPDAAAAAVDVEQFRQVHRLRNELAHGDHVDLDALPAGKARGLLARYVPLVAEAIRAGDL